MKITQYNQTVPSSVQFSFFIERGEYVTSRWAGWKLDNFNYQEKWISDFRYTTP